MREVLPTLRQWQDDGRQFALATVVRTKGSAPREVGSVMGVSKDGIVCGSVSGGCIDATVIDACMAAKEPHVVSFTQGQERDPFSVKLMCGGEVDVFIDPEPVQREPALWQELTALLSSDTGCVLATRFEPFVQTVRRAGDTVCCSVLDFAVTDAYASRKSQYVEVAGEEWFMHVLAPRPKIVIVGAVHISRALVTLAKAIGFETIVIDPRTAYEQFESHPDKHYQEWPQVALEKINLDSDAFAVALTHDPKIDDAAIELFLKSNVAYVGALGSKTTQEKRKAALREKGITDEQLERIHGPVGLDIGAENPEEIALSIIAEIVKVRRERG